MAMGRKTRVKGHEMFSVISLISAICTVRSIYSFPVYQKDMSEHCRRHVIPSVFMGRHVSEANSQMLHFSQLEVPYTCFISVRTELGSNILMVVQLMESNSLRSSCENGYEQLHVYAMGETFGGYWGPLPRDYVRTDRITNSSKYALKTTTPYRPTTTAATEYEEEEKSSVTTPSTTTRRRPTEEAMEVIEVPVVQVSGVLQPTNSSYSNRHHDDPQVFEMFYNVAPRPGEKYETKLVPLLQFSASKAPGREGLYQLDYDVEDEVRTTRRRVTTHRYKPKKYKWLKGRATRRLFEVMTSPINAKSSRGTSHTHSVGPLTKATVSQTTEDSDHSSTIESWDDIYELMKNINRSYTRFRQSTTKESHESILQKISEMKHNKSVYIASDWDLYLGGHDLENTTENISTGMFTMFKSTPKSYPSLNRHSLRSSKKFIKDHISSTTTLKSGTSENTVQTDPISSVKVSQAPNFDTSTTTKTDSNIDFSFQEPQRTVTRRSTLTSATDSTNTITSSELLQATKHFTLSEHTDGTLVDHESWENIVQSANKMAKALNQNSVPHSQDDASNSRKNIRKKRNINPIPIHLERPHTLSTKRPRSVSLTNTYLSDQQKFAHLIEINDDEITGRVNLRQMGEFVGENLFNICAHSNTTRQFTMFNTSRIVVVISNFTMKQMTLVLTSAFPLTMTSAVCPPTHIECQVTGSRVCIDSSNACDGIPNCGNFEIYDEDRLICGVIDSVQHSVTLAAFTFLAVLLTFIYAVHYWLKRCLPKVSEAFFVYTENSENVLYLESIMRSPNDLDVMTKMEMTQHDPFFEDPNPHKTEKHEAWFKRMSSRICFFKKKKKEEDSEPIEVREEAPLKRMYSFAELELKRIGNLDVETRDEAIQTGESLELTQIKPNYKNRASQAIGEQGSSTAITNFTTFREPKYYTNTRREAHRDTRIDLKELNMIKAMKEARASLNASRGMPQEVVEDVDTLTSGLSGVEETELHSMLYDSRGLYSQSKDGRRQAENVNELRPSLLASIGSIEQQVGSTRKRIRFEEVAEGFAPYPVLHEVASRSADIEPQVEPGTAMDFMRFWGGSRGKKGKKKSQLPLRQ